MHLGISEVNPGFYINGRTIEGFDNLFQLREEY